MSITGLLDTSRRALGTQSTGIQVIGDNIANVNTPGSAQGVAISGSCAYVADGFNGIQVVDIRDPYAPRILGAVGTPGSAYDTAVADTYVYVADVGYGLQVAYPQCAMQCNVGSPDLTETTLQLRAFPNPGSSATNVHFALRSTGRVDATVYDIAGRRARTLFGGLRPAGDHELHWDGRTEDGGEAPAGVYVIRLSTSEGDGSTRVVLVR